MWELGSVKCGEKVVLRAKVSLKDSAAEYPANGPLLPCRAQIRLTTEDALLSGLTVRPADAQQAVRVEDGRRHFSMKAMYQP